MGRKRRIGEKEGSPPGGEPLWGRSDSTAWPRVRGSGVWLDAAGL
jgi:hypothetical protein